MKAQHLLLTLLTILFNNAHAASLDLRLIGSYSIPTGTMFNGIEFGGISGIDKAADGTYYAISDDRGGERGTPRFYNLSLDYNETSFNGVTINSQTFMKRPDGSNFPSTSRTVDPESIRVAPNGNLYWSSEGNYNANPSLRFNPFVREMTTSGEYVRQFNTPAMFNYVDNTSTGGRNNKLFEALTVGNPMGTVYVANEDAIVQDGNITTLTSGSVVRITALDPTTGNAYKQYAYELPKIPVNAAPGAPFGPDNGLSEMLAINSSDDSIQSFIMVERAFASGVGNTIRLVESRITNQTTDISSFSGLSGATYTPMTKKLLLELPITYKGVTLDNVEGISWGKTLANGNRTLVLAVDNNFSTTQTTQFLAFEVATVPEPETYGMLMAGLALLGLRSRRLPV